MPFCASLSIYQLNFNLPQHSLAEFGNRSHVNLCSGDERITVHIEGSVSRYILIINLMNAALLVQL